MGENAHPPQEIGRGREPIEVLADEFARRLRDGEHPTIEEYARRYPELAESIRTLFPPVAMMEHAGQQGSGSSDSTASLTQGFRLDRETLGDFRIIREIGRGGMGVVYEAEQHSLNRRVALKILSPAVSQSPRQLQRFHREAEAAARLHHTNIVPVFGTGEVDGLHFYAMQLIDGVSFGDIIDAMRVSTGDNWPLTPTPGADADSADSPATGFTVAEAASGMLHRTARGRRRLHGAPTVSATADYVLTAKAGEEAPPEAQAPPAEDAPDPSAWPPAGDLLAGRPEYWRRIAKVGISVARALSYSHQQGILHRDIKPSNVLLDRDGIVWVADFGLAKHQDQAGVTNPGDIVGTIRYMAPEQFSGQADARSDIHSLGLMLYELLTLQPAYADERNGPLIRQKMSSTPPAPPRTIVPHVPRDLQTIVMKAAAVNPAHRYQQAEALEADLKRYLEDRPITARRIYPPEQLLRWARRNPLVAALSGATVLLLFAAVLIFAIGKHRSEQDRKHTERALVLLEQEQKDTLRARALLEQEKKDAEKARDLLAKEKSSAEQARDLLAKEKSSAEGARDLLAKEKRIAEQQREAAVSAGQRAKRESIRAEKNLKVALEAFEEIIQNISSRGVPLSLEFVIAQEPSVVTPADVQLLESLLTFFDRFATDTSVGLQIESAAARKRVGDIQQQLGRLNEAVASYRQALLGYALQATWEANGQSFLVEQAQILNALGIAWSRRGNPKQAFAAHRMARTLLEKSRSAEAPAIRFELAKTLILKVSVSERAGVTGSAAAKPGRDHKKDCQFALEILADLVKGDPGNPDYRFVLVRGHRAYIRILLGNNELGPAKASLDSAITHIEQLTGDNAKAPAFQYELADTLRTEIPNDQTYANRIGRAARLAEQLVTAYPDIPEYRSLAGNCLSQRGAVQADKGDLTEAVASYERAISHQRPTAERFASVLLIQQAYAQSLAGLAGLRVSTKKPTDAAALLDEAIRRLEVFEKDTPPNRVAVRLLAQLRQQRARLPRP